MKNEKDWKKGRIRHRRKGVEWEEEEDGRMGRGDVVGEEEGEEEGCPRLYPW